MGREVESRGKMTLRADMSGAERALQGVAKTYSKLGGEMQRSSSAMQQQSGALDRAIAKMDAFAAPLGKVQALMGAGGLVAAAVGAAHAIDQFSARALALTDVQANLKISIDASREATGGLVDDFTLQKTAMAGLRYGVFQTSGEMAKHVKIATTLARTLGTDSSKAVEDFTLGIARQSRLILDNLGILVDVDNANKNYAKSIGKTVSQLNDEEKAIAFRNEAYRQGEKAIQGMRLAQDGWAISAQKMKTGLVDLGDKILQLPKNIGEFVDELERSIGISDEASEHYATIARVGLAAITLGGSEALRALKDLHEFMTENPHVLGDRTGSIGFGKIGGVGTRGAQAIVERQSAGDAVIAGLSQSLVVGQRSMDKARKSAHSAKKEVEEVILIYDNFWEEVQREIHLKATEHELQIAAMQDRMRLANGELTIDPFARSEKDERAANDRMNARLRSAELGAANGGGELERIQAERDAKLEYLRFQERTAATEAEMLSAREEQRQVVHEAELARIEEERAARERAQKTMFDSLHAVSSVLGSASKLGAMAAEASGKSSAKRARAAQIGAAIESFAIGGLEVAKAAAAYASFNFPQGIAHTAAAAVAFAQGGLLMSGKIGGAGGSGAANGPPAFASGASFGSGDSGGSGRGSSSGQGRRGSDSEIPGSPMPRPGGYAHQKGPQNVTVVVQGNVIGNRAFARDLAQEIRELDHSRPPQRRAS